MAGELVQNGMEVLNVTQECGWQLDSDCYTCLFRSAELQKQ